MQSLKSCHKVHDFYKYWHIPSPLYRGIKLLEHAMKDVEKIFELRIRQQIEIDDMQFGLMKGKGTTNVIFMARQMQENSRVKGKKLYFGFGFGESF